MKKFRQFVDQLKEESAMAVNAAGAGNVDGIGIGPKGEPGGRSGVVGKMLKRKIPDVATKVSS